MGFSPNSVPPTERLTETSLGFDPAALVFKVSTEDKVNVR